MVLLFGTASETCLEIADRAPYALRSLPLCKGLPHLRGAGRQHGARGLVGYETRGVEGLSAEVQHAANDALGACHQRFVLRTAFESPSASKNTPAGPRALGSFELARLYSLRALVSKGLARDESDASVFSSSFGRAA